LQGSAGGGCGVGVERAAEHRSGDSAELLGYHDWFTDAI
jgi:hypothetical protein